MSSVAALLRFVVVGVRRGAALYTFIVAMAVCLTLTAMMMPLIIPTAEQVGVSRAFAHVEHDFAAARQELSAIGYTGCVMNPVEGKVAQVVCVPRELWFVEAACVFLLWLGLMTVMLTKQFLWLGVGCLLARYGFEKIYRYVVRKREKAFAEAMRNPYWKG